MRSIRLLSLLALSLFILSCDKTKKQETTEVPLIRYSVSGIFPHDPTSFIQGLTIDKGKLFESTGQDHSWIAEVDIATGKQEKRILLDKKYFGEGITILNNKIYQLTWQNHEGFIYAVSDFKKVGSWKYPYEGWGITSDGKNLIVSDGTDKIHFLDTITLENRSDISVHNSNGTVGYINELEFIDGFIYANRWQTNYILKIDPSSGEIVGQLDLSPIADKIKMVDPKADVLNGIAYEKKSKLMLVTGKLWNSLYAIRLQLK